MTTPIIYLYGYAGRSPDQLLQLVNVLDAVVLDIRYNPRSRAPQWNKGPLARLLLDRYHHLPALGNVRYKDGPPVELADYAAGRKLIGDLMAALERPLILMCVCGDTESCHRTYIGNLLRADGFQVRELTPDLIRELLASPTPPAQPTPPRPTRPAQLRLLGGEEGL